MRCETFPNITWIASTGSGDGGWGEVGGKEGVKLEDQYLVTKEGLKLLTNHPLNQI